jgi:hypothetical protein
MTRLGKGLGVLAAITAALLVVGCAGEKRVIDSFGDSLPADGLTLLDVSVEAGDLTVTGDPDATAIDVIVDVSTTRTADGKDSDAIHGVHLELRESADGGALLTVWFDPDFANYFADTTVTMPLDLALNAIVEDGDLSVDGVGAVVLDLGPGEALVTDVIGDVELVDGAGDLTVDGVLGNVLIEDGAGDLKIVGIDGDVEIDDGAGDIDVSKVTGHVTISDGSGEISIDDVGSVTIE